MSALVSIIVASYNKEKFISETINSVINQSYKHWELIIVDDCSTDSTASIISEFVNNDNRISMYRNINNRGANFSRNYALNIAKGEFVIFLDADDLLVETCIEKRLRVIENSVYDFCVFTMGVFKHKIGDSKFLWQPNSKKPLVDFLQHKLPWSILQPIWTKNVLLKLNGFDEDFMRLQDVELNSRALLIPQIRFDQVIENPDCYYRIDNARKNFDQYVFLQKWIDSALKYYGKFYLLAKPKRLNKNLLGTIYATYIQVLYSYKTKEISKMEYIELKCRLINPEIIGEIKFKTRVCFFLATTFNLLPFRVPGVNFVLSRLIVY